MDMTIVWIVGAGWACVVLWTIRTAIGDLRFGKAQIRAYQQWERTGKVVPGWSKQWRWSHPKDTDAPTGLTKVVNQFFVTITQIINVTNVHVKALVLPGIGGPRGSGGAGGVGDVASGAGESLGKVIPGTIVSGALPDGGSRAGSFLGGALGALRGRDAA
jgi:hypothetical protein